MKTVITENATFTNFLSSNIKAQVKTSCSTV